MAEAAAGGWYDVFLGFGSKAADTLSETLSIAARAKLNKELERGGLLEQQRNNESSTNQDLVNSLNPVKGKNADGSTIVSEPISFAGVSVQLNTVKVAGLAVGALIVGAVAFKFLRGK